MGGTAKAPDTTTIVPVLFNDQFPQWFVGIAFGAIVIGALVPAAIMGNLRGEHVRPGYLPAVLPADGQRS